MSPQPHGERYVVALDFGTTFSGVAYARKSFPDDVFLIDHWPAQEEHAIPYCKTPTALWYMQDECSAWVARAWGWQAIDGFTKEFDAARRSKTEAEKPAAGYIVKRFKLQLSDEGTPEIQTGLPPGVTADMAIADYLRGMAEYVLKELREEFGSHVRMKELEWALTVPAIWGEKAKQKMCDLAREAGMTVEGSPPLSIILEPEAASTYCFHKQAVTVQKKDRILVLDVGGGTVDIVVHEKVGDEAEVREVTRSSGGLCGSSYLDECFFKFLEQKINCLKSCVQQDPGILAKLLKQWDKIKRTFSGDGRLKYFDLPTKLAAAWEKTGAYEPDFDSIEFTNKDLEGMFDPVVNAVINLVRAQLSEAGKCKVIFAVGGFSGNPYLAKKLDEKFRSTGIVEMVVVPPSPGAAICHGALLQRLHPGKILSQVAQKMNGGATLRSFKADSSSSEDMWLITADEIAAATDNFSSSNRIGSGGFGEVFKGRHMGMDIAVKKILPGRTVDDKFEQEIRLLNTFRHPHILLLIGYEPSGPCLVSDYMSGGSLQDYLGEREGALTWKDKVRICREMACAVAYMHKRNVVHRDLKPVNVLLDDNKKSKICDMGLAKSCEGNQVTMSGTHGTVGYMDPYSVKTGLVGPHSDTYALGLINLQLLTGIESIRDMHRLLGQHESKNSSFGTPVSRWGKNIDDFNKVVEHFCSKLDPRSSAMPREAIQKTVGLLLRCLERTWGYRPDLDVFLSSLEELEGLANKGEVRRLDPYVESEYVLQLSTEEREADEKTKTLQEISARLRAELETMVAKREKLNQDFWIAQERAETSKKSMSELQQNISFAMSSQKFEDLAHLGDDVKHLGQTIIAEEKEKVNLQSELEAVEKDITEMETMASRFDNANADERETAMARCERLRMEAANKRGEIVAAVNGEHIVDLQLLLREARLADGKADELQKKYELEGQRFGRQDIKD